MNKEITIEQNQYGTYSVYEFGEYPQSSVLAGQTLKQRGALWRSQDEDRVVQQGGQRVGPRACIVVHGRVGREQREQLLVVSVVVVFRGGRGFWGGQ